MLADELGVLQPPLKAPAPRYQPNVAPSVALFKWRWHRSKQRAKECRVPRTSLILRLLAATIATLVFVQVW